MDNPKSLDEVSDESLYLECVGLPLPEGKTLTPAERVYMASQINLAKAAERRDYNQ